MAKETPAPATTPAAEPAEAASEKRTYFFPDFDGHQISVEATSQEEALKKAAAAVGKVEK